MSRLYRKMMDAFNSPVTVFKRNSRLAIMSLILAVLGIIVLFLSFPYDFFKNTYLSIILLMLALILAVVAIFFVKIKHRKLKGLLYAIIAIILALPSTIFVYTISTLPERRAILEKTNTARSNMRQLYKAIVEYCRENDGYLPTADKWCDLLMQTDNSITKTTFKHPRIEKWNCNIAFNKSISGLKLSKVSGNVALLFEADGDWNLTGTAKLLEQRPAMDKKCFFGEILLVDGCLKTYRHENGGYRTYDPNVNENVIVPLRWKP